MKVRKAYLKVKRVYLRFGKIRKLVKYTFPEVRTGTLKYWLTLLNLVLTLIINQLRKGGSVIKLQDSTTHNKTERYKELR